MYLDCAKPEDILQTANLTNTLLDVDSLCDMDSDISHDYQKTKRKRRYRSGDENLSDPPYDPVKRIRRKQSRNRVSSQKRRRKSAPAVMEIKDCDVAIATSNNEHLTRNTEVTHVDSKTDIVMPPLSSFHLPITDIFKSASSAVVNALGHHVERSSHQPQSCTT